MEVAHSDCHVIRPSIDQLSSIVRNVRCPEQNCGRELPHLNALRLHVARHHRRKPLTKQWPSSCDGSGVVFECPVDSCSTRSRNFKTFKLLKQHYMKVHAPRTLRCSLCNAAAFATTALLKAHEKTCSAQYCCECGAVYSHMSSLNSHIRKYQHKMSFSIQRIEQHGQEQFTSDDEQHKVPNLKSTVSIRFAAINASWCQNSEAASSERAADDVSAMVVASHREKSCQTEELQSGAAGGSSLVVVGRACQTNLTGSSSGGADDRYQRYTIRSVSTQCSFQADNQTERSGVAADSEWSGNSGCLGDEYDTQLPVTCRDVMLSDDVLSSSHSHTSSPRLVTALPILLLDRACQTPPPAIHRGSVNGGEHRHSRSSFSCHTQTQPAFQDIEHLLTDSHLVSHSASPVLFPELGEVTAVDGFTQTH